MLKSELDTPSLIIELEIFEKNLAVMAEFARRHGKKLRPHAKTHKCPEIARRQLAAGNCAGICVAKLSEAEKLADAGIQDILITSPVCAPWKIQRIGELHRRISGLQVTVDNGEQIKMLARQGTANNPIQIVIDVDPEMGRTGVAYDKAGEFADFAAGFPTLQIVGVQCYAGHLQHIVFWKDRAQEATRLMKRGAEVFRQISSKIASCQIFTGAGTGTLPSDVLIPELTDVQVGSYCMMDAEYLAVEHGGPEFLPALRILTSVISANHAGNATIDAGTKAIYVTPGAEPRVLDGKGGFRNEVKYSWDFGDEHGHLHFPDEVKFIPGERLEMIVSHCDPTVNLFDELWVVNNGEVVDRWEISMRGCCR